MATVKIDDAPYQCRSCLCSEFHVGKTVSLLLLQEEAKPSWHRDSLSNNSVKFSCILSDSCTLKPLLIQSFWETWALKVAWVWVCGIRY